MKIEYRSGYKYQLSSDYIHFMSFEFPPLPTQVKTKYLCIASVDGCTALTIRSGYAWDGPSGPTIDTKNFMRGSLVHDALYQLIRLEYLDKNRYREPADRELYRICRQDGMCWLRANWVYYALRVGGNSAARKKNENRNVIAP